MRKELLSFAEGLSSRDVDTDESLAAWSIVAEILLKWEKILDTKFDKKGDVTQRRMGARG